MADDIITQMDKKAEANYEELIRLRIVNATLHDEIERLRTMIRQIAPILSSYGDGGVVYEDEAALIAEIQKEANYEY